MRHVLDYAKGSIGEQNITIASSSGYGHNKRLDIIVTMPDGDTTPTAIFRVWSNQAEQKEYRFYNDAVKYYNTLP